MLTTAAALIVGKAVLVANATRTIRRYDRAPLMLLIRDRTSSKDASGGRGTAGADTNQVCNT